MQCSSQVGRGWRSGRRWRWRRRRRGRRGGCGRPGPGGPRSCGCWCDAQRSPGASLSGFMARHIEQPGSRQSKPAAREDLVEALGLGLRLHRERARARPAPARRRCTVRPSATAAAARRSSMRQLVHEPMNTVSTAMSRIGVPASGPCTRAPARPTSRSLGSANDVGVGDRVVDRRRPAPGWCPRRRAGASVGRVEHDLLVERRAVVGDAARASRRAPRSHAGALRRVGAALEVGERGVVGGDQPGRGARPRSTCCRPSCGLPSRARGSPSRGTR